MSTISAWLDNKTSHSKHERAKREMTAAAGTCSRMARICRPDIRSDYLLLLVRIQETVGKGGAPRLIILRASLILLSPVNYHAWFRTRAATQVVTCQEACSWNAECIMLMNACWSHLIVQTSMFMEGTSLWSQ
jgi:hypothetical protein